MFMEMAVMILPLLRWPHSRNGISWQASVMLTSNNNEEYCSTSRTESITEEESTKHEKFTFEFIIRRIHLIHRRRLSVECFGISSRRWVQIAFVQIGFMTDVFHKKETRSRTHVTSRIPQMTSLLSNRGSGQISKSVEVRIISQFHSHHSFFFICLEWLERCEWI